MKAVDEYVVGGPEKFALELRYMFSEFEGLNTEELDRLCLMVLKVIMNENDDTTKRWYYGESRKFIQRGYKL